MRLIGARRAVDPHRGECMQVPTTAPLAHVDGLVLTLSYLTGSRLGQVTVSFLTPREGAYQADVPRSPLPGLLSNSRMPSPKSGGGHVTVFRDCQNYRIRTIRPPPDLGEGFNSHSSSQGRGPLEQMSQEAPAWRCSVIPRPTKSAMAFKPRAPEELPSSEALTARMVGVGMNFAEAGDPDADIEATLVHASVVGMDAQDLRVLSVLTTWFGVHHAHVNADKLVRLVRAQSSARVRAYWAALAAWQRKDRRFARLQAGHRGRPIELLEVGSAFQIARRGEDTRFRDTALRVPAGTLRDRASDVLSPAELVQRHAGYRNRVLMGPSWRADVWTVLEKAARPQRCGRGASRLLLVRDGVGGRAGLQAPPQHRRARRVTWSVNELLRPGPANLSNVRIKSFRQRGAERARYRLRMTSARSTGHEITKSTVTRERSTGASSSSSRSKPSAISISSGMDAHATIVVPRPITR